MQGGELDNKEIRQEHVRNLISELSQKEYSNLAEYVKRVYFIYSDEFRHSYSDITALLIKLDKENENALSNICENIFSMLSLPEIEPDSDVYKSLNKLYDHIALERIRLKEVYKDSQIIIEQTKDLSVKAKDASERSQKLLEETKVIKQEVVALLGIFAAIILAFIGGITFSTSVLANMHLASIYRTIVIILLIGFVVFNILCALFYFIGMMLAKPFGQNKILLILTDVCIIMLLGGTICAWKKGVVEKRNEEIRNEQIVERMDLNPVEDVKISGENLI